jgi:2-polyprenyl-3-methyl-5-hydroxy-6-metoxy-1,4-benzoquinol methylase
MGIRIPVEFDDIVDEIVRHTDLARDEVRARFWREALEGGWNVAQDVRRFGVTPHHYDANMACLYAQGDGFIFETLAFWARTARQLWIRRATDRLRAYGERHGRAQRDLNILMLGDGTGNDSLYLAAHGYAVDYFDVSGSRTFEFARRRFESLGALGHGVHLVSNSGEIQLGSYDAALSFEVLEHLPDPRSAIRNMGSFLRPKGIALVTEAFGRVSPTHLAANTRFDGRTAFLFHRHGLSLTWYSRNPRFKPMEFTKTGDRSARTLVALLRDPNVLRTFAGAHYHSLGRRLTGLLRRALPRDSGST